MGKHRYYYLYQVWTEWETGSNHRKAKDQLTGKIVAIQS